MVLARRGRHGYNNTMNIGQKVYGLQSLFKWLLLALLVGTAAGSASALFLAGLDYASGLQQANGWLLWLLPFGGALVSYMYRSIGRSASRGNNLVLEQVHAGNGNVPLRMAPLVLIGTWLTHLFGGSAGREGTAVQMGGSLAGGLGRLLRLDEYDRRIVVLTGISAGFGSVFGTPLAAAVFGLEASAAGKLRWQGALPCLAAAYSGHYVTLAWGIRHAHYDAGDLPGFGPALAAKLVLASAAFGWAAWLFVRALSKLKSRLSAWIPNPMLRAFAGGTAIVALVYFTGSRQYLGLGLPLIEQSFQESVSPDTFLWKSLFTVVTLVSGYIGGEVTPLFVIGSTLGSALAGFMAMPAPFLAAAGLAAVFGAAAKTPLACAILGMELFGFDAAVYLLPICYLSYWASGRTGIYESHVRLYRPQQASAAKVDSDPAIYYNQSK